MSFKQRFKMLLKVYSQVNIPRDNHGQDNIVFQYSRFRYQKESNKCLGAEKSKCIIESMSFKSEFSSMERVVDGVTKCHQSQMI